jgi:Pyruvate/2-oxoacid:ferredoxin oxidoreductase delta subunit
LFRTEFGTVVVQEDICNGCGYCIPACPYGVIDQREADGRAWKCTMCYDRLKSGLEPACSKACPTDSIQFGTLDHLRERAGRRVQQLQRAGVTSARLYGDDPNDGDGGDGAFFLLLDEPEVYGLPPDRWSPHRASLVGHERVRRPVDLHDGHAAVRLALIKHHGSGHFADSGDATGLLAGEAVRHHGASGDTGCVHPVRIDAVVDDELVDQAGQEVHVVGSTARSPGAAEAGVPGEVEPLRIGDDEVVHARCTIELSGAHHVLGRVAHAAEDQHQRRAASGLEGRRSEHPVGANLPVDAQLTVLDGWTRRRRRRFGLGAGAGGHHRHGRHHGHPRRRSPSSTPQVEVLHCGHHRTATTSSRPKIGPTRTPIRS